MPYIGCASASQATVVASAAAGSLSHKLVHMWALSTSAAEVSRWAYGQYVKSSITGSVLSTALCTAVGIA